MPERLERLRGRHCLAVRLSALGDAILATGVLLSWHERAGLIFDVLTRPALAPLFEHHPAVRDVVTARDTDLPGLAWPAFCRRLAGDRGHMPLIDLHNNLRTRILGLLWPGPVFVYPKLSLERRLFLASRHPWLGSRLGRHNVPQRYALALEERAPDAATLRPRLFLTAAETAAARASLARLGLERPVAIHPYATHPAKTPGREVWQGLVRELHARGEEVLILGRHSEPLFPGAPHDLTNATSLRETAALLSLCRCLATGDSGPMHLATAVGARVAALFGPTTREWGFYPSGPFDTIHQNFCPEAPCSLHGQDACRRGNACLADISGTLIADLVDTSRQTF